MAAMTVLYPEKQRLEYVHRIGEVNEFQTIFWR
jgi:hypothetical protein